MRIERLAHTCYVIDAGEKKIAFDPAMDFYNNLWMFGCTRPLTTNFLQEVSAIFISHSHTDHFHMPTLLFADRETPIYLPASDLNAMFPIRDELHRYGFRHVHEIEEWETVLISNLEITGIPAPVSLEGIPQISYLVRSPEMSFLNTVDTMEDDDTFKRVSEQYPIDILSLPVNCSYNYANLRNQMSPGTAMKTVHMLKPRVFFPTGINFCHEKKLAPTSVPFFPHDNTLNHLALFQNMVPEGTQFLVLGDNDLLTASINPQGNFHLQVQPVVGKLPTDEIKLSNVRGRLLTHLVDTFSRAHFYFGYQQRPPYVKWRKMWVDCLEELLLLNIDIQSELENMLQYIPNGYHFSLLFHYFPKTTSILNDGGELFLAMVARSLQTIDHSTSEWDYVKCLYQLLSKFVEKQHPLQAIVHLEYLKHCQLWHLAKRPQLPSGFTAEQANLLLRKQITNDLEASPWVFPKFNPIYLPIPITKQALALYTKGQVDPTADTLEFWVVPSLQQVEPNKTNLSLLPLRAREQELAHLLIQHNGQTSLQDLLDQTGSTREEWLSLFLKILQFEPYALEFHWLPETGYQQSDDFPQKYIELVR